jgi:hypothetical protein
MAVESKTYQIEDFETTVGNEPQEICEEAVGLIKELGEQGIDLQGQKSLLAAEDGETATRCPFREMNADELWVYQLLLPESVKVEEFDDPMPVEVLRKLKRAKQFFPCFRIFRKGKGKPDPILVAYRGLTSYGTPDGNPFIIIRWGEVLDEWPSLVHQAVTMFKSNVVAKCAEIVEQAKARSASVAGLDGNALPPNRSMPSYW